MNFEKNYSISNSWFPHWKSGAQLYLLKHLSQLLNHGGDDSSSDILSEENYKYFSLNSTEERWEEVE